MDRAIHPDFLHFLDFKSGAVIEQFRDLRSMVLEMFPDSNELLYNTHALTTAFSISEKLGDTFCMIVIYANHMNFAFNKGVLLPDPKSILHGTGKLMRHVPVTAIGSYRTDAVQDMIISAVDLALSDMSKPIKAVGKSISKIKV